MWLGLAIVTAYGLANNCAHFSSCLCICIFICWLFIVLLLFIYFPSLGESNLNATVVVCCLSSSVFFFLPLCREGRPFGFSWKGKHGHVIFFYFFILHWKGTRNRCSIFLDKSTNEVFLVWWYCTIPNISGTICQFEHSLSLNFSSGSGKRENY